MLFRLTGTLFRLPVVPFCLAFCVLNIPIKDYSLATRKSSFCCHPLSWFNQYSLLMMQVMSDPGIHYIGEMDCDGSMRLLSDQLTEGQLQWVPLEKQYDTVVIGDAENARRYPVCGGRQDEYKKALYKSFPKEKKAIDQYMNMLKVSRKFVIMQECSRV